MKLLSKVLIVALGITTASAQEAPPMPPDTTRVDSVVARMMVGIGDAFPGYPAVALADSEWYWSDAVTLPDAESMLPGVYNAELGEEGKTVSTWFLGGLSRPDRITADGVSFASPIFGSNIVTSYPLEFVRDIEELYGPQALLLGARWNIRTHQYSSPNPTTAIRFVQRPFETIFTDGWFSQNIARSTNLLFGFQRRTSDGRFRNAGLSSWNLRGRLRYNVAPWLNVMGTWVYEKSSNGMNGGVDRSRSLLLFDDVSAAVVEPQAYELRTHTFLSVHVLADVLGDSLSMTRFTLSTIDEEREFNRSVASFYQPQAREFAITGATTSRLEQSLSFGHMVFHGIGEYRSESAVDSSVLSAHDRHTTALGASLEARLTDLIVPSVGVRIDESPEGSRTSIAASADLNLFSSLRISGSFEQRTIMPGLRELAWNDSLVVLPGSRLGLEDFTSVRVTWKFMSSSYVMVEGFQRQVTDQLFFQHDTTAYGTTTFGAKYSGFDASGLRAAGRIALGTFTLSGWLTVVSIDGDASLSEILPKTYGRWELTWKDRLFNDELGAQITVRTTFHDRHLGFAPDPRTGLDVLQSDYRIGRMTRLDGFLVLEIGDALVSLSWENILNTDYFKVATYPMPERRFSLGVRWNFPD